jgi:hypothetical protein
MSSTLPALSPEHRHRYTLDEARALVSDWNASGQTPTAWCAQRGIPRTALSSWRRRLAPHSATAQDASPFIEVRRIDPAPAVSALRLELGDRISVTGMALDQVVQLVQALRGDRS